MNNLAFMILMIVALTLMSLALILRIFGSNKYRDVCFIFEILVYAILIVALSLKTIEIGLNEMGLAMLFLVLTIAVLFIYRMIFRRRG